MRYSTTLKTAPAIAMMINILFLDANLSRNGTLITATIQESPDVICSAGNKNAVLKPVSA